jgi:hypothetical protein
MTITMLLRNTLTAYGLRHPNPHPNAAGPKA